MSRYEQWERWTATMRAAPDPLAAADALTTVAGEVAAQLAPERSLAREWGALGVSVESRSLASSGLCVRGTRRVIVRREDSFTRRRYTVAHELAHLLLAHAADAGCFTMPPKHEERLCERFASMALIPRDRLRAHLEDHPPRPRVQWLRATAKHFRVSLSPLVIALRELPTVEDRSVFVLARMAPHRLRPRQVALRIAHSCCPPELKLPKDKRLASLGWRELCESARQAPPGTVWQEHAANLEIEAGPAAPRGIRTYRGAVTYEAVAIAGEYRLVVTFDLGRLAPHCGTVRLRRSLPEHATGQLVLALP
jgi:IrrE N-terminal-like domain